MKLIEQIALETQLIKRLLRNTSMIMNGSQIWKKIRFTLWIGFKFQQSFGTITIY